MTTKLKKAIDDNRWQEVMWSTYPGENNYLKLGNKADKETHGLPTVWLRNAMRNLPWFDENEDRVVGSVWDLPDYEDKAVIFVGASPILKEQWEDLKVAAEHDRFLIVAVNSSAKFLVDRDIIPDYVMCIDGLYSQEWSIDLGDKGKDIEGIFSPFISTKALMEWPGKIRIIPYTWKGKEHRKITQKVYRKWGKNLGGGGNAFNGAVSTFVACTKASIFLFFGNELSWKEQYYAHKETTDNDQKDALYTETDVNGDKVWTMSNLYTYKIWLEKQTEFLSGSYVGKTYCFINCSEGILGVDSNKDLLKHIRQMSLKDAIEKVKGAFDFEAMGWEDKNKFMYEQYYTRALYGQDGGHRKWVYLADVMLPPPKEVGKTLDVGCGIGRGLKYAVEKGYDVRGIDIADLSDLYWKPMEINDRCQQGGAAKMPFKDGEFPLVVCTEVFEHIPMEGIEEVLNEIYRVGSDKFYFTISLGQSFVHGTYIHLTVQPAEWWIEKLEAAGYIVKRLTKMTPQGIMKRADSFVVYAVKDDEPYKTGERKLFREGFKDKPWVFKRDETYYYPEKIEYG